MSLPYNESDSDLVSEGAVMPEVGGLRSLGEALGHQTTDTDQPPAALDLTRLLQMFGDEPLTIAKVLGLFVRETEADMAYLVTACCAGHAARIASVAHRVKGAASGVGAERLRREAERIETLARGGEIGSASQLVDRLQSEFDRVRGIIAEIGRGKEKGENGSR